jgi:hypothetical protein
MKYNKSEIMKAAWAYYRTGNYRNFSLALSKAWREARKVAADRLKGMITFAEVNIGDTLTFEYGDHGNTVTRTVTAISESTLAGYTLINCGEHIEICVRMNDTVMRVAEAVAQIAA